MATVEDLQAQTRLKTTRALQTVDATLHLLALDLASGCDWIIVRQAQNPKRQFSPTTLAACNATQAARDKGDDDFLQTMEAAPFFPAALPPPPA